MAQITLRSYIEYIEDRLQRDAHPEVVAQCRHVLASYPRYIEIYKLLARSLLDQENYQDALDLFQRVLSADPNDFLAHVGISECYRENGALDQAIWHLERAFEQVPNNTEIQDEIRRLYAERDGQIPRRLYLTNGALARLYLRGRLHQQAIAELRTALAKDPERTDLRVLLAQAFWEYQAAAEAGQVAAEVLRQLPNSIDANRILALLWLRAGEREEARPFLERLRALDPYLAHRAEHGGAPPAADAFRLDMLEYTADRHATEIGAADWVSQLDGIGTQAPASAAEPESVPAGDAVDELRGAFDDDSADWLSELDMAGEDAGEAAVADAELPTLDDLAGVFALPEDDETEQPAFDAAQPPDAEPADAEEGTPDWLADILAEEEEDEPTAAAEDSAPPEAAEVSVPTETPDWLSDILEDEEPAAAEAEPEMAAEADDTPEVDEGTPDWLSEILGEETEAEEEAAAELEPVAEVEDAADEEPEGEPDWLSESLDEEPEAEADEEVGAEPEPAEEAEPAAFEEPDVEPDWLSEILAEEADDESEADVEQPAQPEAADTTEPEAETFEALAGDDETPDWLAEILGEEDEVEEEPVAEVEDDAEEQPDWLDEVLSEEEPEQPLATEAEPPDELEWDEQPVMAEEADAPQPEAEVGEPDWIQEMQAVRPDNEAAPTPAADPDELPAWLSAIPGEPSVPLFGDDETFTAQPDWLNDVWGEPFAQQKPEHPVETEPRPETEAEPAQPEPEAAEEEPGMPDWLAEITDEPEEAAPLPAAEAPSWLEQELEAEADDVTEQEEAREVEAEPVSAAPTPAFDDDDDAPDWLRQELLGEPVDESPGGFDDEPAAPAATADEQRTPEDEDADEAPGDMPGWLRETLAEEEPAVAEVRPAEPAAPPPDPADDAEMPEWLRDAIHGQRQPVAEVSSAPEEQPETPDVVSDDWLDEIIGGPGLEEGALDALDDAADEWLTEMGQGYAGDPFDDLETWDEAAERVEQTPPPAREPASPAAQVPPAVEEAPEPEAPAAEPEPEPAPPAQPRSGLLSRLGQKNFGTDKLKAAPPPPSVPDLPDWLHDPSLAAPRGEDEAGDDEVDG